MFSLSVKPPFEQSVNWTQNTRSRNVWKPLQTFRRPRPFSVVSSWQPGSAGGAPGTREGPASLRPRPSQARLKNRPVRSAVRGLRTTRWHQRSSLDSATGLSVKVPGGDVCGPEWRLPWTWAVEDQPGSSPLHEQHPSDPLTNEFHASETQTSSVKHLSSSICWLQLDWKGWTAPSHCYCFVHRCRSSVTKLNSLTLWMRPTRPAAESQPWLSSLRYAAVI